MFCLLFSLFPCFSYAYELKTCLTNFCLLFLILSGYIKDKGFFAFCHLFLALLLLFSSLPRTGVLRIDLRSQGFILLLPHLLIFSLEIQNGNWKLPLANWPITLRIYKKHFKAQSADIPSQIFYIIILHFVRTYTSGCYLLLVPFCPFVSPLVPDVVAHRKVEEMEYNTADSTATSSILVSLVIVIAALALAAAGSAYAYNQGYFDPLIERVGVFLFRAKASAEAKELQARGMKAGEDFVSSQLKGNQQAEDVKKGLGSIGNLKKQL